MWCAILFWALFPIIWYRRWVPLINRAPRLSEEIVEELIRTIKEADIEAEIYVIGDCSGASREIFVVADELTPTIRADVLKLIYRNVPPLLVPLIHITDKNGFEIIRRGFGQQIKRVWPK
jgi:hypothetical protein